MYLKYAFYIYVFMHTSFQQKLRSVNEALLKYKQRAFPFYFYDSFILLFRNFT